MEDIKSINELAIKKAAPLKASEILKLGIPYSEILKFQEKGDLIRVKSGYYMPKNIEFDEEAIIIGLFPDAVLTMDTALFYHGYINVRPKQWSLAVSKNISKSRIKIDKPSIKPYYTEPHILYDKIVEKDVKTGRVKLYGIDRLICDILKYENRLPYNILQTAIKNYIEDSNKNIEDLFRFAKERKVAKKVQHMVLPWIDTTKYDNNDVVLGKKDVNLSDNNELDTKIEYNLLIKEILSEESVAEAIYQFIKTDIDEKLMQSFINTISKRTLSGMSIWRELKKKERIKDIIMDKYEHKRQKYLSENANNNQIDVFDFINPILQAIKMDEVFFGDWMPEIRRFL